MIIMWKFANHTVPKPNQSWPTNPRYDTSFSKEAPNALFIPALKVAGLAQSRLGGASPEEVPHEFISIHTRQGHLNI